MQQSRRKFMAVLAALPFAGILFGRQSQASIPSIADWSTQANATPIADMKAIKQMMRGQSDYSQLLPLDVTGKPTPLPMVRGTMGVHYFRAPTKDPITCTLNGVDVTNRTSECDAYSGWVRMFDVDAKGNILSRGDHGIERIHFGKVEVK